MGRNEEEKGEDTTGPKTSPTRPENDPRSTPKWCQEGPKRDKKATRNRKTNNNTDHRRSRDHLGCGKDICGHAHACTHTYTHPTALARHFWEQFGHLKRFKTIPRRSQIEAKNQEANRSDPRRSRIRIAAILRGLGAPCRGKRHQKVLEHVLFRETSLFR